MSLKEDVDCVRETELDPRYSHYEELCPPEKYELQVTDIIFLSVRCLTIAIFLICFTMVVSNLCKARNRLKCWRLYLFVSVVLLLWLGLSLYQDHLDEYFFDRAIFRFPQRRSIYWFVRNLIHGITLYLIILLMSHLSDFQHRGWWFLIVAMVITVPLLYSIVIIVIDLRLDPERRFSWQWNVGIDTFRVFLYNTLTTILLLVFSPRFCTRHLFGTYSENRSPFIVLVSRWTFGFLLVHNLTVFASYGAAVSSRIPVPSWALIDVEGASIAHRALDEAQFFFIVMAVPVSLLAANFVHSHFSDSDEIDRDMSKVDKIYSDVWTPSVNSRPTAASRESEGKFQPVNLYPIPEKSTNGLPNGNQRSRHGSESSYSSLAPEDFVLVQPSGNKNNKRRHRESYMEAISLGSFQEEDGRFSRTSEPVDL